MIVLLCVDNGYGMRFAGRRQSQDRLLRQQIRTLIGDRPLWMDPDSARLFQNDGFPDLRVCPDFLEQAGPEDFCFVEKPPLAPWRSAIRAMYLFHWNRAFPADELLDLLPWEEGWHCTALEEFPGSSHERITLQGFVPPEK